MPTKTKAKPSITAAEKRVIRYELKILRRAQFKILRDADTETRRIEREIAKLYKSASRTRIAWDREDTKIQRRIAILEGRL